MNFSFVYQQKSKTAFNVISIKTPGKPVAYFPSKFQPLSKHKQYVQNAVHGDQEHSKRTTNFIKRKGTVQVFLNWQQIPDYYQRDRYVCPDGKTGLDEIRSYIPKQKQPPFPKFKFLDDDPVDYIKKFKEHFKNLDPEGQKAQLMTLVHPEDKAEFLQLEETTNEKEMQNSIEEYYTLFYLKANKRKKEINVTGLTIEKAGSLEKYLQRMYEYAQKRSKIVGLAGKLQYILSNLKDLPLKEKAKIDCKQISTFQVFKEMICYKYSELELINQDLVTSYSLNPQPSANRQGNELFITDQVEDVSSLRDSYPKKLVMELD